MNAEINKVREDLIAKAGLTLGKAAYKGAIGARKQWEETTNAVQDPLRDVVDVAHAQATVKSLQAKAGEAYAGAIHANSAKEMLWLRPQGKAGKDLAPPDGMEEAQTFARTSVGQYLGLIARNIGKAGLDGIPKAGERLADYNARCEASEKVGREPQQPEGPQQSPAAAEPTAVLSAPAQAVVSAMDDADGNAEPFQRAFARAAQDAAKAGVSLAFWQHAAAEMAAWMKARALDAPRAEAA